MNVTTQSINLAIATDPKAALALEIIERLRGAGYIAYLAGGCVRDALLGLTPKDYDVATDARPEQIRSLFGHRRTLAIGAAFGVIGVMGNKRAGQEPVEVATFRSDGDYSDGRHPDAVRYSTPAEDASRRDFTINGLFYDPKDHAVIDFIGGRRDLQHGQIRAIGEPDLRFAEDKLRLLRAVRFATTYRFEIEPITRAAIVAHAPEVTVCSGERIGVEMRRLLESPDAGRGVRLLRDCRLAAAIMPRIAERIEDEVVMQQLAARLSAFDTTNFSARLGCVALCCSPAADEVLADCVSAWRLSNADADAARAALRHYETILRADRLPWSVVQPLLVDRYASSILDLARAIARAEGGFDAAIELATERAGWPQQRLNPPPLLTGEDLKRMGMRPGPQFKVALEKIRAAQLDGQIETKEQATEWVRDEE